MTDSFARNEGQPLAYYPIYNPSTRKRESFIVLSAGIDGELDNLFSEKDSLYIDSWWEKVDLYNLQGFFVDKYKSYCKARSTEFLQEYEPADCEMLVSVAEELTYPEFSLADYFFGKKDLLLQLDSNNVSYKVENVAD